MDLQPALPWSPCVFVFLRVLAVVCVSTLCTLRIRGLGPSRNMSVLQQNSALEVSSLGNFSKISAASEHLVSFTAQEHPDTFCMWHEK